MIGCIRQAHQTRASNTCIKQHLDQTKEQGRGPAQKNENHFPFDRLLRISQRFFDREFGDLKRAFG